MLRRRRSLLVRRVTTTNQRRRSASHATARTTRGAFRSTTRTTCQVLATRTKRVEAQQGRVIMMSAINDEDALKESVFSTWRRRRSTN